MAASLLGLGLALAGSRASAQQPAVPPAAAPVNLPAPTAPVSPQLTATDLPASPPLFLKFSKEASSDAPPQTAPQQPGSDAPRLKYSKDAGAPASATAPAKLTFSKDAAPLAQPAPPAAGAPRTAPSVPAGPKLTFSKEATPVLQPVTPIPVEAAPGFVPPGQRLTFSKDAAPVLQPPSSTSLPAATAPALVPWQTATQAPAPLPQPPIPAGVGSVPALGPVPLPNQSVMPGQVMPTSAGTVPQAPPGYMPAMPPQAMPIPASAIPQAPPGYMPAPNEPLSPADMALPPQTMQAPGTLPRQTPPVRTAWFQGKREETTRLPTESSEEYQIQLEPPGPQKVFKLESEAAFRERLRQEARQRPTPERIEFPDEPVLSDQPVFAGRYFPPMSETVEPAYVCYKRLLFEDKNFDRYGWDLGFLAPFLSAGAFYFDVVTLPYHLFTDPCRCCECSAGYCLPGDPVPFMLYPPGLSVTGLMAEVGSVVAIAFILP